MNISDSMYTAKKDVTRAARKLDEHFDGPEWAKRINLTSLNIKNNHYCILGQLYGDYIKSPDSLAELEGFYPNSPDRWEEIADEHDEDFSASTLIGVLETEWKTEIRKRLETMKGGDEN